MQFAAEATAWPELGVSARVQYAKAAKERERLEAACAAAGLDGHVAVRAALERSYSVNEVEEALLGGDTRAASPRRGCDRRRRRAVAVGLSVLAVLAGVVVLLDYLGITGGWLFPRRDVYAVGGNQWGQLGDGTTGGIRSTAVAMASIGAGNLQMAAGTWHTVVLRGDGAVYAVGWNFDGQLGDGTTGGIRS
eukprot:SAG11_NODE_1484_length_4826_cov_4.020309_1_plen_191_part_10